jgi:hypothetical protein
MFYDEEYYETKKIIYKYRYFTNMIYSISNKSKYAQYYIDLCENILLRNYINKKDAKEQTGEYIETHHIVPCSIDKTYEKSKDNLLYCTAREHFILHKLLSKMFIGENDIAHRKMLRAVTMFKMVNNLQHRKFSSRDYEYIRKCYIESVSGIYAPLYGKEGTVKGKKCYNNGLINKFFKEGEQPEGFHLGLTTKGTFKLINNGVTNMNIKTDDEIPEGWTLGSITKGKESPLKGRTVGPYTTERKNNISIAISNKMWITNGNEDMRISITEEIPEGWRKGRTNGNYFGNTKITCDICNNYTSNIGNVSKHKKKCNG